MEKLGTLEILKSVKMRSRETKRIKRESIQQKDPILSYHHKKGMLCTSGNQIQNS